MRDNPQLVQRGWPQRRPRPPERLPRPHSCCASRESSWQNRDSLARWNRYQTTTGTTLEQELLPISIAITGNIAVVTYYYSVARENYKKEREAVTGHYMDVLVKDKGSWKFIAWAGGDDPKN